MNLEETWALLEGDRAEDPVSGRIQRRILPAGHRDFFLGLEIPSRNRMLILRTSPASVDGQAQIPESRGLSVRMHERQTDPPTAEVELVLKDTQHRDIFDLLIQDLVDAAGQPEDERAGAGRFLARLTEWQALLMKLVPGVISRENQQGLWSELWTLREVVGNAVGFAGALRGWRGPAGADQDFQVPGAALEVKSSTANTFERLTIASERQLDVASDIELAVIAISLDARPDHGETLREMVTATRSDATDAGCLHEFEGRLVLYGYRDEDADHYDDIGYTVRSRRQFKVQDDFPRIVSGDLRDGVREVRYSVGVTACTQFEIVDEELTGLLGTEL